jgi:hypothetical protein
MYKYSPLNKVPTDIINSTKAKGRLPVLLYGPYILHLDCKGIHGDVASYSIHLCGTVLY